MKKGIFVCLIFAFMLVSSVDALGCDITTKLVNQDPYPAIPGEYVKVVFELSGVNNPSCQGSLFEISPEYPLSSDPGQSLSVDVNQVSLLNNYKQTVLIPYKLRVYRNAVDEDAPLKTKLSVGTTDSSKYAFEYFNITIKDVASNFDVILNDYSYATNNFVLAIINVGKNDAESLIVSIPKQESIKVNGASEKIIGSLSSNDDTSVSFNAVPKTGVINVVLSYNDETNTRRTFEHSIEFPEGAFENTKTSKSGSTMYYVIGIVILVIIYFVYRKYKKNIKKAEHSLMRR